MAFPAFVQRKGIACVTVVGTSSILTGALPSKGMMAMRQGELGSLLYQQEISFESGETTGHCESWSVICCGSPPSIGTLQMVNLLVAVERLGHDARPASVPIHHVEPRRLVAELQVVVTDPGDLLSVGRDDRII